MLRGRDRRSNSPAEMWGGLQGLARRLGSQRQAAMTGTQAQRVCGKRGRKTASESRATEIRARLLSWKQAPKQHRISLRALARELGTSHQLVGHYLACWEKWRSKEHLRAAKEIRVRAAAETRPGVETEMLRQAHAFESAAFQSMLGSALDDTLRQLKRKARGGQLSRGEIKMLKLFVSKGYRDAQETLDRCCRTEKSKNNLPLIPSHTAKSFRCVAGVAGNSAKLVSQASPKKAGVSAKSKTAAVTRHAIT